MKFEELNLVPELLQAIRGQNIETCTDIQQKVIPYVLEGKDVSGLSQTGTGKTLAFLAPIIDRIVRSKSQTDALPPELKARVFADWKPSHFVLVLGPTRELVDQIHEAAKKLCGPCGIKTAAVIGGVDLEPQKVAIQGGAEIIIGTPGRLLDLYNNHVLHFKHIRAIIFDEADRMFDMGFKDDMNFILQRCPPERQILLFSATLNFDVLNTAYKYHSNPIEFNVSRDQVKAVDVDDEIFHVGETDKPNCLLSLLTREKPHQTIIFSNFKNQVDRIANFLSQNGQPAVGISSLLTQAQREKVLTQFKNQNEKNILVATDLAARGLDIKGVDLVINYELPDDPENYVHRIGRTGRAGAKGKALSLVCDRDVPALSRIEGYLKLKLKTGWLEDKDILQGTQPMASDDYRGPSRIRRTGMAAAKDRAPFEQSLRKPRRFEQRRGRHGERDQHRDGYKKPYDRGPRDQNFKPQQQTNGTGEQHVHRDRRMKRHQEERANKPHASPRRPNDFKSNRHRSSKPRHFQRSSTPKETPIIQKVTSFLKKLFE